MTTKDHLKSARKRLQFASVKDKVQKIQAMPFDEADKELDLLHKSLSKTFGEKDAAELIEEAIISNDKTLSDTISSVVSGIPLADLVELGEKVEK